MDGKSNSNSRRAALKQLAGLGTALMTSLPSTTRGATAPTMNMRAIPATDEQLPVIGAGTWQTFDVGESGAERAPLRDVLNRFAAAGGKVIDSSPMYGRAEAVVGELAAELGLRERLFYATKVWTRGKEEGVRQMNESFRRLRVARMDLMQIHNLLDVPAHTATLKAMKQSSRVRYIGITHYHESAYADLERLIGTKDYDFLQINYSLGERTADRRLLPLARDLGVAVVVNRPFMEGALFRRVQGKALPSWATEFDCASWAQFFLKWILGHPAVTCTIPSTGNAKHLLDNVAAGFGRLPDEKTRRRMAEYIDGL
jgi:diketogulonate reductase-like aldo/keto reductase